MQSIVALTTKDRESHEPEEVSHDSEEINSSWTAVGRSYVLLAAALHRRLPFKLRTWLACGSLPLIAPGKVLKVSLESSLAEAEALDLVIAKTKIPVPRVYCAFTKHGKSYILMEKMKGRPLDTLWHRLSDAQKDEICNQLRNYLEELRLIAAPEPGRVGNVSYQALIDPRLPKAPCGPFESVQTFQKHLIWKSKDDKGDAGRRKLIDSAERDSPTCLSHCDLNMSNILIDGNGITGIIDWEMAGWYPEYWEYVMASNMSPHPTWQYRANRFLKPFPYERALEDLRQQVFPTSR
jgi:serine/threonine protein kinase